MKNSQIQTNYNSEVICKLLSFSHRIIFKKLFKHTKKLLQIPLYQPQGLPKNFCTKQGQKCIFVAVHYPVLRKKINLNLSA